MEDLCFELNDATIDDQKQTNSQVSHLIHACQCIRIKDTDCRLPSCQRMKRRVQHTRICKEKKTNRDCTICKKLNALCCFHAKSCLEAKCSVPFCFVFKMRLWRHQARQITQQARILKRRIVTMQNRGLSGAVPQPSPENSNSSCQQPSLGCQPHSSSYQPQPSIDMKPSLGPSDLLQDLQQLEAKATTQFGKSIFNNLQHIIISNFDINNSVVNPSVANAALVALNEQLQMQKSMLQVAMAGPPSCIQNVFAGENSGYAQNQQSHQSSSQPLPNP